MQLKPPIDVFKGNAPAVPAWLKYPPDILRLHANSIILDADIKILIVPAGRKMYHTMPALGLQSVEASRAGILATVEPMVATLFGILVFSEPLTLSSGLGIVLILGAVILLNLPTATAE